MSYKRFDLQLKYAATYAQHRFTIRALEDEVSYEVKLSGDAEHKTLKPPEWLSLLNDKLARIVAKTLYAREKQGSDVSPPAA